MAGNAQDQGGCLSCLGCLGMLLLFPTLWNVNPLLALLLLLLYLGSSSNSQPPAEM